VKDICNLVRTRIWEIDVELRAIEKYQKKNVQLLESARWHIKNDRLKAEKLIREKESIRVYLDTNGT